MARKQRAAWCIAVMVVGCAALATAQTKKQFHYPVGPHATILVVNQFGPVVVKASNGHQVDVVSVLHSPKIEVDPTQTGNRLEFRTHFLQKASPEEGRVDYELSVPADASVTVNSASGPISADGLRSDVILEGDAAQVSVRNVSSAHVHVKTLNGSVTLQDISDGHVEVTSLSGPVTLTNVDGSLVAVNTTSGKIAYTGDFGGGGEYTLSNHSGDIEVSIPANASVDISARSIMGSVENDFPFQQKSHPAFQVLPGKALAGTSNSGASSVRLRSFSGKIRVKKQ